MEIIHGYGVCEERGEFDESNCTHPLIKFELRINRWEKAFQNGIVWCLCPSLDVKSREKNKHQGHEIN